MWGTGHAGFCYACGVGWAGGWAMDFRIFWSVLAALLVAAVLGWLWHVAEAGIAINQMQQAMHHAVQDSRRIAAAERRRQAAMQWAQAQERQRDIEARTLSDAQQCIDNVVVEIHGNVYTQPLYRGEPIPCTGTLARYPLR